MITKEDIIDEKEEMIKNVNLIEMWHDQNKPMILRKLCRDLAFRLHMEGFSNYECLDIAKAPSRQCMVEMYGTTDHIFVFDSRGLKIIDFYYGDGSGSMRQYAFIEAYHYIWSGMDTHDGVDWIITDKKYDIIIPNMLDRMMIEYNEFKHRYKLIGGNR